MTQTQAVLNHLLEYGYITTYEAIQLYGATRLSDIIYRLRHKMGYTIESEPLKVKTRYGTTTSVAKYKIKVEE